MSAYSSQIRDYIDRFRREVRDDALVDPHELAEWAFKNGLHKPSIRTIIDAIAADISQAFREEYRTDERGLRYRAKHAVKRRSGEQNRSLWADLDDAQVPRDHFVQAFAQRRLGIVGDCVQLKTDVEVYNSKWSRNDPIQVVLDFRRDVAEALPNLNRRDLEGQPASG